MNTAQARRFLRESNAKRLRRLKRKQRTWTLSGDTRKSDGEVCIIDGYDTICTLWQNGLVHTTKRGRLICDAVNNFKLHRQALRLLRKLIREAKGFDGLAVGILPESTRIEAEKLFKKINEPKKTHAAQAGR